MQTQSLVETVDRFKQNGNYKIANRWTDLVAGIVSSLGYDNTAQLPVVEVEKNWIEAINIARALAPITMKTWSTGRTLDYLEKSL